MKDKVCQDFVFMPLGGASGGGKGGKAGGSQESVTPGTAGTVKDIVDSSEVKSKIVVVGNCGCGKTILIRRYIHSEFVETYTPTGFDTFNSTYRVSDTYRIQVSVWDTSGDAGYDRVRPLSYADADLILICFSVADPDSLQDVVAKWHPEVREHCPTQPIMLVGCKTDLRAELRNSTQPKDKQSIVTYDQGLKTAKHIGALVYSETSAKTSQKSVNDVLEVAALSSAGNRTTGDNPSFRRQRSFIRRKRFSGMSEARMHLQTAQAEGCVTHKVKVKVGYSGPEGDLSDVIKFEDLL